MTYQLEGSILEVCDCKVLCPCWIGEDPDNGTCDSAMAYHIDRGTIAGIDVSGLTVANSVYIPGNILHGNFKVVIFVDDRATPAQADALAKAWTGKLGGPLADLAQLIGEVRVERAPITFTVEGGKGTLRVGSVVDAEMEPYRGPTGEVTTLNESIFTTIPGAPAYVAKATHYRRNSEAYGLRNVNLRNHNAIQGSFRFAV